MTLFEECIEALSSVKILKEEDSRELKNKLFEDLKFGVTTIDWNRYPNHLKIESLNDLIGTLNHMNCFVVWDNYEVPVIETNLMSIRDNLDDVLAVSFDTWIIDENWKWIIEFHHEGGIKHTSL